MPLSTIAAHLVPMNTAAHPLLASLVRGLIAFVSSVCCVFGPNKFAAAELLRDVACKGCLLLTSGSAEDALPLVVVLHGDEGHPRKVAEAWAALAERGLCEGQLCKGSTPPDQRLRVFLPSCPRAEGCLGSYWRWGQSPDWLFDRIDEVSARYALESNRVYVAGWSGGATYIGMKAEAFSSRVSGLSLVGGGAPSQEQCLESPCVSVDYLMGDANPLFELARNTRDRLSECGHPLRWQELAHADHGAEWRAYQREIPAIASRLLKLSRAACESPIEPNPPAPSASPDPPPSTTAPSLPTVAAKPPAAPASTHGCTCQVNTLPAGGGWLPGIAALILWVRRRLITRHDRQERSSSAGPPRTSAGCST